MSNRRHYVIHRIYRFRRPLRRPRRCRLVTYVIRYPELAFMIGFVAAPIAWAIYCALRVF
jgi:hypothetical protein